MPVPEPKGGETQDQFVSRCMSWASENEADMPREQQLAMCFSTYRKAAGESITKGELMRELAHSGKLLRKFIGEVEADDPETVETPTAELDDGEEDAADLESGEESPYRIGERGDTGTGEPEE